MPTQAALQIEREFPFDDHDFTTLSGLVKARAGIILGSHKRDMVYARLARRLRSLGLSTFAEYRVLLEGDPDGTELANMINAITTNLTRFFREEHHFEHLRQHVFEPALAADRTGERRKLRIWSAGCSSGQEAYSIAMTMVDTIADHNRWDVRILATDLDTNMLKAGAAALYSAEQLEAVPDILRRRFTAPASNGGGQICQSIRQMVSFKHLNLLGPWPLRQACDAIFCRNVVIYFDTETKQRLIHRLIRQLKIGGFLYLGHSESLMAPGETIRLAGRTTYRRAK